MFQYLIRLHILFGIVSILLILAGCKGGSSGGTASGTSIDPPIEAEPAGDQPAFPFIQHVDQASITSGAIQFDELFLLGDILFETVFRSEDGVGALALPDGSPLHQRFSRVPPGGGRFTGPNGQACNGCHNAPFGTSAGLASSNVVQDPAGLGQPPFNFRNTISLFGSGLVQRLAEEMTDDLLTQLEEAKQAAVQGGPVVIRNLESKGISFGSISLTKTGPTAFTIDASQVDGVSPDLVVRPFGWKGDHASLRSFTRGAAKNEMGLEADELVVKTPAQGTDPDKDGVENELSVGDITSLTIYIAAQETPTTIDSLVEKGIMAPLGEEFASAARRGAQLFNQIGCNSCHVPELQLRDPSFEEPTLRGGGHFRDPQIDPASTQLNSSVPFRFNLVQQGDNPRPVPDSAGFVRVPLFGDLKRHNMGAHLADAQETAVTSSDGSDLELSGIPQKVAIQEFLTPELWGVGSTGPWLHDGRASSLDEAIMLHGVDTPPAVGDPARSEAQEERDAYLNLPESDRIAVVTFLRSLVLFEDGEEE